MVDHVAEYTEPYDFRIHWYYITHADCSEGPRTNDELLFMSGTLRRNLNDQLFINHFCNYLEERDWTDEGREQLIDALKLFQNERVLQTKEFLEANRSVAAGRNGYINLPYGAAVKYASLIILVVQNASYVFLTSYVSSRSWPIFLSTVAVFHTEVVKLITCLVILTIEQWDIRRSADVLYQTVIELCLLGMLKVGPVATAYVAQNYLLNFAVSKLDAATYMVTYQLNILTTAIFTVALRRKISFIQWVALVLLFSGVSIVQLNKDEKAQHAFNHTDVAGLQTTMVSITEDGAHIQDPYFLIIFVIAVPACFLSGFAGVYFEKILQDRQACIYIRSIQRSLLSLGGFVIMGIASYICSGELNVLNFGVMQRFDVVVGTVAFGAVHGLVEYVAMKHADRIAVDYATSVGITVGCIASAFLFSFPPSLMFLAGTGLVIAAVFIKIIYDHDQNVEVVDNIV